MADSMFGDPLLFVEFNKPRDKTDKILLEQFQKDSSKSNGRNGNVDTDAEGRFHSHSVASGSESENDNDSESEGNSNLDSDAEESPRNTEQKEQQERRDTSTAKKVTYDEFRDWQYVHSDSKERRIAELEQEIQKLQKQSRVTDPTIHFDDDEGPALQVIFMNHDFSRKYKTYIEKVIYDLIQKDKSSKRKELPLISVKATDVCLSRCNDNMLSEEKVRHLKNTSTASGCTKFYKDFVVDSMGWPLVDFHHAVTDGWEIPKYEQLYRVALPRIEEEENEDQPPRQERPKASCFNCGENHMIGDCPNPKDFKKISQNKKEYQQAMQAFSGPRQIRYHAEVDPRFAKFRPGVISDELQEALGLRKNQLAPFIYQMRVCGYPPGWLEEAKCETSGLTIYDKGGKHIGPDDSEVEDGEVDLEPQEQYDLAQLIEYPGFNVPVPDGLVDESDKLGMPPMQQSQMKEVLESCLTPRPPPSRKRKKSDNPGSGGKQQKIEDMDLSGISESEQPIIEKDGREAVSTPTMDLEELEEQKRLLEQQLAGAEDGAELLVMDSVGDSNDTQPPATPQNDRLQPIVTSTPYDRQTNLSMNMSHSISVEHGTPLAKNTLGKKDTLPDASKFAADMEDEIPFENLPNAVGTFERMRKIIGDIRKLKEENDD